jgi:PAS domain S-box-containing protein
VSSGDAAPSSEPEGRLLRQILQTLDQGILVGKDTRTRYANRRAAQMLGCTLDELMTRSILGFIPEEERAEAKDRVAALRQGVVPEPFDQRLRLDDGTTLIVESHVRPMFDRAGRYEGSVSLMRDVTEQRADEAQARFRAALLDAVGEALMATTADGTIAYMNEAAEAISGWRAQDVIGNHVDAFPNADGAREVFDEIRRRVAAGKGFSTEVPMLRRDGSQFIAHFTTTPVAAADGELIGRINVIRDLTEQRQLEEDLHTRQLRGSAIAVLGARALGRGRDSASSDEVLLRDAVEATRRLLDADRAGYLEVNEDGSLSPRMSDSEVFVSTLPPGTGSLAGFTVLARTAVVVDDIAMERRFDVDAFPPGTRSAIAAPVFGPFGVRGVLSAGRGPADSFDDAAADFVQAMANVIGVALK